MDVLDSEEKWHGQVGQSGWLSSVRVAIRVYLPGESGWYSRHVQLSLLEGSGLMTRWRTSSSLPERKTVSSRKRLSASPKIWTSLREVQKSWTSLREVQKSWTLTELYKKYSLIFFWQSKELTKDICSFLFYSLHIMLVNVRLDISGCERITLQACRFHWSN